MGGFIGEWIATSLLTGAYRNGQRLFVGPPELQAFTRVCERIAAENPALFPNVYSAFGLQQSEAEPAALQRFLEGARDDVDFPTPEKLVPLFMAAWREKRAQLTGAEAAGFFQLPEPEAEAILRKLAQRFSRELAQIPSFRDPLLVSAALNVLDEPMQAVAPAGGGEAGLFPVNGAGMNIVAFGEGKYESNGAFSVLARFHILAAAQTLLLRSFEGVYWAYGCPCLNGEPSLSVDGKAVRLENDWAHLTAPVQLPAGRALSVAYRRKQRPPLMRHAPADCDYGDIIFTVKTLTLSGEEAGREFVFRFEPGGKLVPIPAVREVPHLTDQELSQACELGRITPADLDRLKRVDPVSRYMTAATDNETVGDVYGLTKRDVRVLREILADPEIG